MPEPQIVWFHHWCHHLYVFSHNHWLSCHLSLLMSPVMLESLMCHYWCHNLIYHARITVSVSVSLLVIWPLCDLPQSLTVISFVIADITNLIPFQKPLIVTSFVIADIAIDLMPCQKPLIVTSFVIADIATDLMPHQKPLIVTSVVVFLF